MNKQLYIDENNETFNLLNNRAETPTQFINAVMAILFTIDEHYAGIINGDDPKKSRPARREFDIQKINLLKSNSKKVYLFGMKVSVFIFIS